MLLRAFKSLAVFCLSAGSAIALTTGEPSERNGAVDLKLFSAGNEILDGETGEFVLRLTNNTQAAITFEVSRNNTDIREPEGKPRSFPEKDMDVGLHHSMLLVAEMTGDLPEGIDASGALQAETMTVKAGETKLVHFMIPPNRLPSNRLRVWVELTKISSADAMARSNMLEIKRVAR